jgi:hypothetical protein
MVVRIKTSNSSPQILSNYLILGQFHEIELLFYICKHICTLSIRNSSTQIGSHSYTILETAYRFHRNPASICFTIKEQPYRETTKISF